MWRLPRLRHDIARRDIDPLAAVTGEGLLREHAADDVKRLLPLVALGATGDPESSQLCLR
jgi:hypothetical protein